MDALNDAQRLYTIVDLNGEKIVDIQLDKSESKDRPLEGYIGLQDHGEPNTPTRCVSVESG